MDSKELEILSGRGYVNTPQFPGGIPSGEVAKATKQQIEYVRSVIKREKKIKGFSLSVATNFNEFNLQLSGTARLLLGLALLWDHDYEWADYPTEMTFKINNEIVIDQVAPVFFNPEINDLGYEYWFIPRPLSGSDDLTLQVTGQIELQMMLVLYYI